MYSLMGFKEKRDKQRTRVRIKRLAFDEPNYCRFIHRSVEEWNLIAKLRLRRQQRVLSRGRQAEEKSRRKKKHKKSKQKDCRSTLEQSDIASPSVLFAFGHMACLMLPCGFCSQCILLELDAPANLNIYHISLSTVLHKGRRK